jgi:hypothetical protein
VTLVEDKMRRFKGECAHFTFNKCIIYTHDGASAKFSTNSHETDNSVVIEIRENMKLAGDYVIYIYCTPGIPG